MQHWDKVRDEVITVGVTTLIWGLQYFLNRRDEQQTIDVKDYESSQE